MRSRQARTAWLVSRSFMDFATHLKKKLATATPEGRRTSVGVECCGTVFHGLAQAFVRFRRNVTTGTIVRYIVEGVSDFVPCFPSS